LCQVDPLEGRELDVVEALPWAAAADEFGLEQADLGLGQGGVKRVPDGADRRAAPSVARRSVNAIDVY